MVPFALLFLPFLLTGLSVEAIDEDDFEVRVFLNSHLFENNPAPRIDLCIHEGERTSCNYLKVRQFTDPAAPSKLLVFVGLKRLVEAFDDKEVSLHLHYQFKSELFTAEIVRDSLRKTDLKLCSHIISRCVVVKVKADKAEERKDGETKEMVLIEDYGRILRDDARQITLILRCLVALPLALLLLALLNRARYSVAYIFAFMNATVSHAFYTIAAIANPFAMAESGDGLFKIFVDFTGWMIVYFYHTQLFSIIGHELGKARRSLLGPLVVARAGFGVAFVWLFVKDSDEFRYLPLNFSDHVQFLACMVIFPLSTGFCRAIARNQRQHPKFDLDEADRLAFVFSRFFLIFSGAPYIANVILSFISTDSSMFWYNA